jgi:type 1 fimbriae regulatory protein FimB/type 1 fimbriae regulatory protein FimE
LAAATTPEKLRVSASVPGMAFPIHPHMLRYACVYVLANTRNDTRALQAWMWHKSSNIRALSEFAPERFKDFGGRGVLRWAGVWIVTEFEPYSTRKANV